MLGASLDSIVPSYPLSHCSLLSTFTSWQTDLTDLPLARPDHIVDALADRRTSGRYTYFAAVIIIAANVLSVQR